MNEKLTALLAGLEETPVDGGALSDLQHPELLRNVLEGIRRWAGIPAGPISLTSEFFAAVFGHGREGLLRIYEAFTIETMKSDEEAAIVLDALKRVVRQARVIKALSGWTLDDVKPNALPSKARMMVLFDHDVNERLRAAAGARGETLSAFVQDSVRVRLSELEGGRRRRATVPAESEAATA